MLRKSKSGGLDVVRTSGWDGRSRSGGNAGNAMEARDRKTKSGRRPGVGVVVKEEEHFLDVEELQELIATLKSPPEILTWEDFRDRYGLECGPNSINPHRCRKDKDLSDKTMQELGLRPEGAKDRGGYSWSDCKV